MKSKSISRESGAVSLFVVIIAMLLISVVTIGFLRLMMNNQLQATNNDLSQSALDSAQAGVEDAKRALLRYQQICENNGAAACAAEAARVSSNTCNVAVQPVVDPDSIQAGKNATTPGEVLIQQTQSSNDKTLEQAYTCVTVQLDTDSYEGDVSANSSKLIPLFTGAPGSAPQPFQVITIQWFIDKDFSTGSKVLDLPATSGGQPLSSTWPENRPSVLRAQLMQYPSTGFKLTDFDNTQGAASDTNTVFLYPHKTGNASSEASPIDWKGRDRRADTPGGKPLPASASDAPLPILCSPNLNAGGYACSATLRLPDPIGGTPNNRIAYLRLSALYNPAHFKVTMQTGVTLKGVQPIVDSTGRANDLFRRVQSHIDMYDTSFPYPDAAIDVTGNFCKDFSVTNTDYVAGSCTP